MSEPDLDEMFAAVGRCLGAWSSLERALTLLFLALHDRTGIPDEQSPLQAAFECVQSFEVRLSMVNATVQSDPRNVGLFSARWNAMKNKIGRGAKRRAQVAHFTIITHMQPDQSAIRKLYPFMNTTDLWNASASKPPRVVPLTLNDLCNRQASFSRLARQIRNYAEFVHAARGTFGTSPRLEADLAHLLDTPPAQSPTAA